MIITAQQADPVFQAAAKVDTTVQQLKGDLTGLETALTAWRDELWQSYELIGGHTFSAIASQLAPKIRQEMIHFGLATILGCHPLIMEGSWPGNERDKHQFTDLETALRTLI